MDSGFENKELFESYWLCQSTSSGQILDVINSNLIYDVSSKAVYSHNFKTFNARLSYINKNSVLSLNEASLYSVDLESRDNLLELRLSKKHNNLVSSFTQIINDSRQSIGGEISFSAQLDDRVYFNAGYLQVATPLMLSIDYEDFSFKYDRDYTSRTAFAGYGLGLGGFEHVLSFKGSNYANKDTLDLNVINGNGRYLLSTLTSNHLKDFKISLSLNEVDDDFSANFYKDEDIFYKINIFKKSLNKYLLSISQNLSKGSLEYGISSLDHSTEISSRAHIDEISDNLVAVFTVPKINVLDMLDVYQRSVFIRFDRPEQSRRSSYMVSLSQSDISNYHRASTPPLNPLIPIVRVRTGEYKVDALNFIADYSFKVGQYDIGFQFKKMIPFNIAYIEEGDEGEAPEEVLFEFDKRAYLAIGNTLSASLRYNF